MKILFVRAYCPNSILYGAEMRASRFVDYFRRNLGQVDLMTLTKPSEHTDLNYIRNNFVNFYHFDQKNAVGRLTSLEKFLNLLPWQITGNYTKNIQLQIDKIVEENQYDLIFVFKLEPIFYFLQLPKKWYNKIIIDFDDIISDLYRNHYKNIFVSLKNSFFLRLYEHKALSKFKRVFVCSKDAVSRIAPQYKHKTGVVPNIFQINKNQSFPVSTDKSRLLFVGSLDYFPNTEGLEWFFKSIWPSFQETHPYVKLTVIGKTRTDTASVEALLGHPKNVEIFVNVLSVLPHYQNCFATIVPLLNGSGTRLKILESVSFNRPVLTTTKGMEGLDFQDHKDLLIFNNPQSFVKAYEMLLNDDYYQKITQHAFQVLTTAYSQSTFDNSMDINVKNLAVI